MKNIKNITVTAIQNQIANATPARLAYITKQYNNEYETDYPINPAIFGLVAADVAEALFDEEIKVGDTHFCWQSHEHLHFNLTDHLVGYIGDWDSTTPLTDAVMEELSVTLPKDMQWITKKEASTALAA